MRVLVVGGGGREHALCWKIKQSPRCEALYCAPGNGGIGEIAEIVRSDDVPGWAAENRIDLAVIGPDNPLAEGIVDELTERGVRAFGPTRAAAQIEWSKGWAKQLCRDWDIPTTAFATFDRADDARAYVDQQPEGVVVKADGLALGKGVTVCRTRAEAHAALDALEGGPCVIEELVVGREISVMAVCDGTTYRMLPFSCDHKAIFDGNKGPNTGGMGTYSPPTWLTPQLARELELRVVAQVMRAMRRLGRPFVGFLYPGVFVTESGIKVFEFNARMGDPEAQVLLPRLDVDLLDLLDRATDGRLSETPVELPLAAGASCCVVAASPGYPGSYPTGLPIEGLDRVDPDVLVFQAGTKRTGDGLVTAGGRVLGVTAVGDTVAEARAKAYANVERVRFEGIHYRRDIAAA
jgi:phosphoribosylamine--glycine ligase